MGGIKYSNDEDLSREIRLSIFHPFDGAAEPGAEPGSGAGAGAEPGSGSGAEPGSGSGSGSSTNIISSGGLPSEEQEKKAAKRVNTTIDASLQINFDFFITV